MKRALLCLCALVCLSCTSDTMPHPTAPTEARLVPAPDLQSVSLRAGTAATEGIRVSITHKTKHLGHPFTTSSVQYLSLQNTPTQTQVVLLPNAAASASNGKKGVGTPALRKKNGRGRAKAVLKHLDMNEMWEGMALNCGRMMVARAAVHRALPASGRRTKAGLNKRGREVRYEEAGQPGAPADQQLTYVNDHLRQSMHWTWKKTDGGWVASNVELEEPDVGVTIRCTVESAQAARYVVSDAIVPGANISRTRHSPNVTGLDAADLSDPGFGSAVAAYCADYDKCKLATTAFNMARLAYYASLAFAALMCDPLTPETWVECPDATMRLRIAYDLYRGAKAFKETQCGYGA